MTTPLLEAALSYAKMGWHIFPCRPQTKAPLTAHGVKDATTDEATIQAWWTRTPNANIAVACGPASGIFVVDVDVDTDKGVNGWDSIREFPPLPETLTQESPRGGAHFFFRTDNPPRNQNNFRKGIDIRSEGFYLMLAPSVHPNGKTYRWVDGHGCGEMALAEFPEALRPPAKNIPPWERVVTPPPARPVAPTGTPIIERASLYLRECEAAVQGQGGHAKLLWAANALVNGFDLDDNTALSLLWHEFNPRCIPSWDSGNPAEAKDFERKVREARRTCTKPRGWLLDEYNLRASNDDKALEYGARLAAGLLQSEVMTVPNINIPTALGKATRTHDWPDLILHPTGYVGNMVKWINATAMYPQPKLAVLCALTSAGTLFGQKVREPSNQRTNIYSMGVAPSSAGKDHAFKCVAALFKEAGASNLVGGNSVTSDSAIEVALLQHPVKLFPIDEAGDFLTGLKSANAGGAQYLGTIKPCLKTLWSSASGTYKGKQRADDVAREIEDPCISIWATTTTNRLYEGISMGDLEDGFVARMLIGVINTRPDYIEQDHSEPPESLVEMTRAWVTRQMPEGEGGNIISLQKNRMIMVPAQPVARKIFTDFAKECGKLLAEGDTNADKTASLWGKCVENAKRVALILAAGDEYSSPEIGEYHAVYATTLVRQSVCEMIESIDIHMSENSFESDKKRIVRIVTKAGRTGISKTELTRKTQFIRDKRTRDNYITELMEGGQIILGTGISKALWVWAPPYGINVEGEQ